MASDSQSVSRPCPSCGARLKIGAARLHQKLQCPKCLSTIILEPEVEKPPPPKAKKKAAAKKTTSAARKKNASVPPPGQAAREDMLQQQLQSVCRNRAEIAAAYARLRAEHHDLAGRYGQVVTAYDELLNDHAEIARQVAGLDRIDQHLRDIG